MFAVLLLTFWLVSLVVAAVWVARLALHLALPGMVLTIDARRDLMSAGGPRARFGDSRCA